jgi:hypothetical protein
LLAPRMLSVKKEPSFKDEDVTSLCQSGTSE